jgi:hypothetical protein
MVRVDEAAEAGEAEEQRNQRRDAGKDQDGIGNAEKGARADGHQPADPARRIEHVRTEGDAAAAIDDGRHGKGGEDRRHFGDGDQDAGDQPAAGDQHGADQHRLAKAETLTCQPDGERNAHHHDGNHGQVDAAPDHHEAHADSQRAENGDILQQGQEIALGEEIVEEQRKGDEQSQRDQRDYAFLSQPEAMQSHGLSRFFCGHVYPPLRQRRSSPRQRRMRPQENRRCLLPKACPVSRLFFAQAISFS